MKPNLLVRLAVTASIALARPVAAAPPSVDECLANLRKGPDTFIAYLCLGTPGLPERASEVRAVLERVLRQKPGEPHARLYLGLMKAYQMQKTDESDFTKPLEAFVRQKRWVDAFLAQLSIVERACIIGGKPCQDVEPLLDRADQLAGTMGDPTLGRLAAISRLRWALMEDGLSEARTAEQRLDTFPGPPPAWLLLLETTTRGRLAEKMGDDLRVRELYSDLLARVPRGSVAHAAALASVAAATAQLAFQGLAGRKEAERLLREALETQRQLEIRGYNSPLIGTERTSVQLSILLGPSFKAPEDPDGPFLEAFRLELLLQEGKEGRAKALQLARDTIHEGLPLFLYTRLARAHVEFRAGSQEHGEAWAREVLHLLAAVRKLEPDEDLRMREDSEFALAYQTLVSDLLETGPLTENRLEFALQTLEQLRARALLARLMERERGSAPVNNVEEVPSLAELRSALRDDEALVSFMVWAPRPSIRVPYTQGHSAAIIVTKAGTRAVRIAQGELLQPEIKAWTGLIDHRQLGFEPGTRRLYEQVLRPVIDALPAGVNALTIVPDGPLHRIPFDALSETGGPPFVAERFSVATVPSAAVWLRLRQRPAGSGGVALAFANTPDGPAVSFAEKRGEVRSGQLAALLHAREEAEEAVQAFPKGSRMFTGEEATPDRLTPSELAQASLVHFAAHGVANDREPEDSFLLLAPGTRASGKLRVSDIPRFNWSGKTVVLSACETSVGAFRFGEGVLSIARGFFAGGASSVIGTLSQVRDDDQRSLFHGFYKELRRGISVGEAMTAAKRALIRTGAPPAAWANVIVLGDATVHPRAPDPAWPRWAVLGGSVVGLAVLVLGLRARRRKQTATSA